MTFASVVAMALLSQSYVRSRVEAADAGAAQCFWWQQGSVITWSLNDRGNPTATGGGELTAIRRAFDTWQAQMETCGSLRFEEGGRTTSRKVGYFKEGNENVVLFRTRACNDFVSPKDGCRADNDCGNVYDCWQFGAQIIAITTTSYNNSSGRILDSDIEFNASDFSFTTVDAPTCPAGHPDAACVSTDVQNTITHEIGHLVGLAHAASSSSTMSARADPGELTKRILDPGTKQFVCDVYPKGGLSKTCVTPVLDDKLGKSPGCAAAPGSWLGLGALALWLARPRRRVARS